MRAVDVIVNMETIEDLEFEREVENVEILDASTYDIVLATNSKVLQDLQDLVD